ncbi:MAG: heparinase II/III family protein [Phycisphaerae bacterium]|nr:heparinase II/III family protein [Phycisphaerae bacterium]
MSDTVCTVPEADQPGESPDTPPSVVHRSRDSLLFVLAVVALVANGMAGCGTKLAPENIETAASEEREPSGPEYKGRTGEVTDSGVTGAEGETNGLMAGASARPGTPTKQALNVSQDAVAAERDAPDDDARGESEVDDAADSDAGEDEHDDTSAGETPPGPEGTERIATGIPLPDDSGEPVPSERDRTVLLAFPVGGREPQWPLKTARALFTDDQIFRVRQLCDTDALAIALKRKVVQKAANWIEIPDEQLYWLLPDSRVPRAFNVSAKGCPIHGTAIYQHGRYPWVLDREAPFTITCPVGGEQYPSNDFGAYLASGMQDRSLLTGPYADDGRGWVAPDGEKYWFVAHACHEHWKEIWLPAVKLLSLAYAMTGDPVYARKAIVMLDRIATVYPEMDYSQQSRYSELTGGAYQGKILNHIAETLVLRDLAVAYDLAFDALVGDAPISLPWRSPQQIRANIEANLLEEGIDAVARYQIVGNFGLHQSALAHAAVVRQQGPTEELLDGIFTHTGGARCHEGFNYALYNLVFKDGMPFETSPCYCADWVNALNTAAEVIAKGGCDLYQHRKFPLMFHAPLKLLCNGQFTPANGDSGSITSNWTLPAKASYRAAYRHLQRPSYAWALGKQGGLSGSQYTTFEALVEEPLADEASQDAGLYASQLPSRVLDGYGMTILNNENDSTAVSLYYGIRGVHGHYDRLSIELFGHDRRLSPDLGYPDFMNDFVPGIFSWTHNTISHNTVMVDESKQRGNVSGKVLRFHNSPAVQVVDVDGAGSYEQATTYRRTLVLVNVGNENAYLVDVFRVQGGESHVLSIHGQEGEFSLAGAGLLPPPVTEGTLAGPDVSYGELYDDPVLGAPGYSGSYYPYDGSGYQHLFNWQSITPDVVVTGQWDLAGEPSAQLRVHVVPHPGQELVVADARVSPTLKIPTILKYMLLRRSGDPAGNTFVTVWEPASGPFIDQIVVNDDRSLGSGCDKVVVLSVRRGDTVDVIAVAPEAGSSYSMTPEISSDAAVAVVSVEGGHWIQAFAAGGSWVTGTQPGHTAAVPQTITGQVIAVDYGQKAITVDIGDSPVDASSLAGLAVRIFNDEHASIYTIASAAGAGTLLKLHVSGSDVFTGRIKPKAVDCAARTLATDTYILYAFNMAGMCLVTEDLTHGVQITSMDNRKFQLIGDADLGPFAADLAEGKDAWIADFGVGDQIEIERFVHEQ